jgi:GAF domain-containing protein
MTTSTIPLPSQITLLQGRIARLREALGSGGDFFAAARRADPLPGLQDLAGDWLRAEEIAVSVPAGTGPLQSDDPRRLCAPILIGRRVVGRIEAQRGKPFDEDDRALSHALGQIIGAALEQSMLQGQVEQLAGEARANADTLERLLGCGRAIVSATARPASLAGQIAKLLPEMVGGERASVLLLPRCGEEHPVLLLSNGFSTSVERAREVAEHGLAGMVLRDRAPLIIDETDTDRRWVGLRLSQSDERTRCAMAAPLIWGERTIGALTVTTTQSRLFNTAQLNLLELVACQVSIAIHAAHLEAQLGLLARRLDGLASILEAALQETARGDLSALERAQLVVAQLRAEAEGLLVRPSRRATR